MCSRFTLGIQGESVLTDREREAYTARAQRLRLEVKLTGDIAPTDIAPVLAPGSLDRAPSLYPMQWGFRHPTRALSVINARSETAASKDMFSESTFTRRCLIPAAGYYEWKKDESGHKQKYLFRGEGKRVWLGGLYFRSSHSPVPVFIILTQDAPESVREIHARMPLLFREEDAARWLNADIPYTLMLAAAQKNVHTDAAL